MENLQVTEVDGVRVLTTEQLAKAYGTNRKIISNNFNRNKDRYISGKHYIPLRGEELRHFKSCHQIEDSMKKVSVLYLWTEKGALLHAKSLNTDVAWEVYDYLVDFYFRVKQEEKHGVVNSESNQKMISVVNVPENRKMLEAIQKARRDLTAMDVLLEELIRYHSEENYKEKVRAAAGVIPILVGDTSALLRMEPKIIQRPY